MRIDDSGFRKRTVNNSLMTRQLILSTRGSKKMINAMGTPACTFKQLWDNVSRDGWGFPRAGRAAPRDFPRASPSGNPSEQPCQPSENPVLPSSFTQINPNSQVQPSIEKSGRLYIWVVVCSLFVVCCLQRWSQRWS